jgi:hypothetical protein
MKTNINRTGRALRSSPVRWKNHLASWKTYALAGGASLAAATSADAQVVHTEIDHTISNNSTFKFTIAGRSVSAKVSITAPGGVPRSVGRAKIAGLGGIFFGRTNGFAVNYPAAAPMGVGADSQAPAAVIRSASHITAGNWWRSHGQFGAVATGSHRAGTVQGFMGFLLPGPTNEDGWLQIRVGQASSVTAGLTLTIIDYAYNSAGGSINAGDTGAVPEPGTMALALMAAGAAGLASIRRARAKFPTENQLAQSVGGTDLDA